MILSSAVLLLLLCYFDVSSQACNECECCEGDNACVAETKSCKNGCIAGFWGDKCIDSCRENCITCTSDIYCTECKSGFWGTGCIFNCGKGCVNNTCLKSGNCDCKSNNFRSGYCSSCIKGKVGDDCDENCPNNCGSCTSITQCGWCKYNRYYGSSCQFECSVGCSSGSCKKDDGTCSTCNPGFTGNKCDSCITGKHGTNCDLDCPENCAVCSSNSNCTECKHGYFGSTCTTQCPNGCNQSACDMNGICTHGCKEGLNITFNCEKCAPGNWGDLCQYTCADKCFSCTSNEACTKCIDGYYGPKCSIECPTHCVDSVCKFDGECYACTKRHFGAYCESQCSNMCINGTCSMSNGHCFECQQGFYGDFCSRTKCEDGFYGINCKMECQDRDSSCITCLTNKSGMYGGCTKCTTGKFPYISFELNQTECTFCPECRNGSCDPSNGYCIDGCRTDTKYGNRCLQNCSNHCKNQSCERTTGHCSNGCEENRYGRFCENECTSTCKSVKGKRSCNASDGYCMYGCLDGFHGEMCDKKCSDKCANGTCLQTTAQCLYGCKEGFSGLQCTQAKKQDGHTTSEMIGATFGAGLFGLLIGIVFTFVFITWKRRRKERKGDESNGNPGDGIEIMATQDRDGSNNVDYNNEMPATYEELKVRDERTYSQITSNQQMSLQAAEYINC